jgi:hypothetical protein
MQCLQEARTGVSSTATSGQESKQCPPHHLHPLIIQLSVLIPRPISSQPETTDLFVIDWEFTQLGPKAYDLGQILGDLYERLHFTPASAASVQSLIRGFAAGYGVLDDDEAFRVAIHAGQHLVCWYIRRDPTASFGCSIETVREAVRVGTEFVVRGWKRQRRWFERSELACLFGPTATS